jgi:hypothetical protein
MFVDFGLTSLEFLLLGILTINSPYKRMKKLPAALSRPSEKTDLQRNTFFGIIELK